jgi:hypothetical protein
VPEAVLECSGNARAFRFDRRKYVTRLCASGEVLAGVGRPLFEGMVGEQ